MRKLITALPALLVLLILSVSLAILWADGNETLGPPTIEIAQGSGVVAAGTGMINQPGTININVPGTAIKQTLIYWQGHGGDVDTPATDDTITVNDIPITGTLIGEATLTRLDTYRADITSLGLVSLGPNTLSVSDMDFGPNGFNWGAGVMVIFEDGSSSEIEIRDGSDFAYIRAEVGPLRDTVPQTFFFSPTAADRIATLSMFFSSVAGEGSGGGPLRPTSIEVTVGGSTTTFSNELGSSDGDEWDTFIRDITIPAEADQLTVQAFSRDDLHTGATPASLGWAAAGLSVPVSPAVDANIQINPPTAANEVGTQHTLTITVNAVGGTLGAGTATAEIVSGPGEFVGDDFCNYAGGGVTDSCDVVITSAVAGTTVVSATSDIPVDGLLITRSTDGVGLNSHPAEKTWVAVRVFINPPEAENPVGTEHVLTIRLEQSVQDGVWTPLDGELVTAEIIADSANASFMGPDSCTTGATAPGECVVTITSDTAGTTTVEASWAGGAVAEAEISAKTTDPDANKDWVMEELAGCTPGFWKNHTDIWDSSTAPDVSPSFDPDTLMSEALGFDVLVPAQGRNNPEVMLSALTIEDALNLGGGNLRALVRHSAAALLNADSLAYPFSLGTIQTLVSGAFDNGDANFNNALNDLEAANEIGCGFDAHGNPI